MTEPVFRQEGPLFVPTGHARGPWDPSQQHGGAPAALVARAVERLEAAAPMRCSRLTLEFLGAVPLAPLRVEAEVLRGGPRLQLCEATVSGSDGRVLVRARAVRLRVGEVDLEGRGAQRAQPPTPGPDEAEAGTFPGSAGEGFHLTGMEIRFARGQFGEPGPALAWFRPRRPLVDEEEPTPLQRVAAAADFGNGVSSELRWDRHLFVNTDLTVHLLSEPRGPWVGLEARTLLDSQGRGLASSTLWDGQGELGASHQTLFVDVR
ncbi:thioesterase family protein [Conexibacter sp. SYSU D00693]|uniref:thioesterase family protein n=1 Tax=Conexibacter sp. SYSU D00693 TaxID=2812560 RepID=UPI00196A8DA2|nr:thioesterase family protein [Conexibacter sp. SYSU D00693]